MIVVMRFRLYFSGGLIKKFVFFVLFLQIHVFETDL